jgi:hypothetical protein
VSLYAKRLERGKFIWPAPATSGVVSISASQLARKIPAFLRLRIVLRVHSFEGKFYCVPENGAQSTKRVFSPLAELLALKTQSGDSTRRRRCG